MKVLILQSCDGDLFKPMLDLVEIPNRLYCEKMGYDYKRWDGIKLPTTTIHPSFGACNRIYLLQDELESGVYDWALWMDADAVVVDNSKTVDDFIDCSNAIVACRGADDSDNNWNDFNNGVCFFNLRHPRMPEVLRLWREGVEDKLRHIEKANLFSETCWEIGKGDDAKISDQGHLHGAVRKIGDFHLCNIYKGKQAAAFNYDGPFIQQIIRSSNTPTMEDRLNALRNIVKKLNL